FSPPCRHPSSTPFPYTTLFRSWLSPDRCQSTPVPRGGQRDGRNTPALCHCPPLFPPSCPDGHRIVASEQPPLSVAFVDRCEQPRDRKSTRLNSSHRTISYAVFC